MSDPAFFYAFTQKNRLPTRTGFTLLETVFALTIFSMMALLFSAVLPISQRAARRNACTAQAAAVTQHKIAQARAAGFAALQNPAALAALGIIDGGSASSQSVPYTASFLGCDRLQSGSGGNVLPPGTTASLTVNDYAALNPSVPPGTVSAVTVTVCWPAAGMPGGTVTLSGLVIQSPHS